MPDPNTAPNATLDLPIDGGDATPNEAKLAAELETPPAATAAADTPAPVTTPPPDPAAAAAAVSDTPAAPIAAAPTPPVVPVVPAASATIIAQPKPEAPKDFAAERRAVTANERAARAKYDAGEIDDGEWTRIQDDADAQRETLAAEQAAYAGRLGAWDQAQVTAAQQASASFNTTAAAWEAAHKDFMADPLRKQVMQQAIEAVDRDTGFALAPQELLARAEKSAFDFCRYTDPATPNPVDATAAIATATAGRQPPNVPSTLAMVPAAAPIERGANALFTEMDGKPINDLEDALARMSPQQIDAYLRDAPGAASTGAAE